MVTLMKRVTGFPKQRVVGQAGVLDSSRYRTFVAMELGVSVESVSALVLGGHGDDMVPVRSYCQVGGVPVEKLIPGDRLDAIEKRTRNAGGEVVALLKTGSAFYSPASAAIQMAEAHLFDKKQILPCAALLEGEYGVRGVYAGFRCRSAPAASKSVIEIELSDKERKEFAASVDHVKELVGAMDKVLGAKRVNIHEYQAKEILRRYKVNVPRGKVCDSARGGGGRRQGARHAASASSRRRSTPAVAARAAASSSPRAPPRPARSPPR